MFFRMIFDDALAQAAYLIGCQKEGVAIVIDPERDIDRYIDLARKNNLRIIACAETHIHADFLSGCREMAEAFDATVYLSGLGGDDWNPRWLHDKEGGGSYEHVLLKDGDKFTIGFIEFQTLHTPGHTPEHISFLVTDHGGGASEPMGMLSGDFVFVGDLGRPDLLETAAGKKGAKEASAEELYESASTFVQNIPEHAQIWPAHGAGSSCGKALGSVPQSTAGYEKRFSPPLQFVDSKQKFTQHILEGQPEPPLYFKRMKHQNRDGVPILGDLPRPLHLKMGEIASMEDVVIVDTRSTEAFKPLHLPGSISSPLGSSFHTSAGVYVQPDDRVLLVVEESQVEQAVREMVRIGLDHPVAYITPEDLQTYADSEEGAIASLQSVTVDELSDLRKNADPFILDVRKATEHRESHIPGAKNKSHTRLPELAEELPKDREIYVHCAAGVRSVMATSYLKRQGLNPINVNGGFNAWSSAKHETTSETGDND